MADSLLGGIIINEILVDPNGAINFDTDGNGTAGDTDEFVELYNSSNSAINISGLQLWDGGVGNWFTFPANTILQPGGHALVMTGVQTGGSLPTGGPNDLFFSAGRGSALINNGGDNVIVYDPTNNQYIAATYNGDPLDNPTLGGSGYTGFPSTATQSGAGENFGNDTDGQSLQRTEDGANTFGSDTPTPGVTNICFADGSHILTPAGERLVESLRPGDLVLTDIGHAVPVIWVFAKTWSVDDMVQSPHLAPVRIAAGAFGPGLPHRDLFVSQQHRILLAGAIVERMFGNAEVLVPAIALVGWPGVTLDPPTRQVSYLHLMLDEHRIMIAEGLRTESLHLGAQTRKSIPAVALAEVLELLDLTLDDLDDAQRDTARPIVGVRRAKALVARHIKNGKPLLQAA